MYIILVMIIDFPCINPSLEIVPVDEFANAVKFILD
ncbi:MAG: hypothetical protein MPEBLZ_02605 [Candidatus Methanoperedens nitroreducens]|uniref:Uncharacterized protein n=1 Tax=Candidatus Methanoperedens nitratireducens TaxID=1392998 RepID=A0A0P8DYI2_9EURY|nr:MAG: hypothetical protein MPEBLZ_02605 [Candidatus Methanoperedens sp. BLZ1]